jgi:predicted enzyme related to lactoylglutathione lyase
MKTMNPVVHFEMPAKDRNRMVDFYAKVFGWQAQLFGEEMGNYATVTTGETDTDGRPKNPGFINGGFYPLSQSPEASSPSIVISVENISKSMEDVVNAGGKLLGEPVEIPEVGKYVSFVDTEGNRCSLLEPLMR